jgi:hypothetical protein
MFRESDLCCVLTSKNESLPYSDETYCNLSDTSNNTSKCPLQHFHHILKPSSLAIEVQHDVYRSESYIRFYQFYDTKALFIRDSFTWHTMALLKDCPVSMLPSPLQNCKNTSLATWNRSKRENTNVFLNQAAILPYTWPNGHRLRCHESGLASWWWLQRVTRAWQNQTQA